MVTVGHTSPLMEALLISSTLHPYISIQATSIQHSTHRPKQRRLRRREQTGIPMGILSKPRSCRHDR